MKTNTESWINTFVSFVKGDTDSVKGESAWRMTKALIESAIHRTNGDIVQKQMEIAEMENMLIKARYNNGTIPSNDEKYVNGLIEARNKKAKAEKELEALNGQLEFLQGELELIVKK